MSGLTKKVGYVTFGAVILFSFYYLSRILMYVVFSKAFLPYPRMMGIMDKNPYILEVVVFLLLTMIFTGLYLLIFRKERCIEKRRLTAIDVALMLIAGFGILGISSIWIKLAEIIPVFSKSVEMMNASNEGMAGGNPVGIFLLAVVFAPLLEETVFRGIVFRLTEKVTKGFGAVIISAAIFGVFHMNLAQAVYSMIMGVAAGMVYMKTRNLWFPIILHCGHNLITALQSIPLFKGMEGYFEAFTIVMIIPMGYIIWKLLRKSTQERIMQVKEVAK